MMTSSPPGNSFGFRDISSTSALLDGNITSGLTPLNNNRPNHRNAQLESKNQLPIDNPSLGNQQGSDMFAQNIPELNPPESNELMDFVPISAGNYGDPSLHFTPLNGDPALNSNSGLIGGKIPESFSASSISSMVSVTNQPNPSISSTSISNIDAIHTPLRSSNSSNTTHSNSAANLMTTPIQTPVRCRSTPRRRKTISGYVGVHRRSRFGEKSPLNGNNPFYTPPSFLSPKITKHRKQTSISNSISLTHLDTDLKLQQQLQQHNLTISPLTTPLRTPGLSTDGLHDEIDEREGEETQMMDPSSSFISPSLLMKGEDSRGNNISGNINNNMRRSNHNSNDNSNSNNSNSSNMNGNSESMADLKFGGKLSDLQSYEVARQKEQHQKILSTMRAKAGANGYPIQSIYDSSNAFINQDFLDNPQDIMLLIDSDNVEDAHADTSSSTSSATANEMTSQRTVITDNTIGGSGHAYGIQPQPPISRLPRTKSMPVNSIVGSNLLASQILRRKLRRSRSTINLSEIAASKEVKNAAMRGNSMTDIPEVNLDMTERDSREIENETEIKQEQSAGYDEMFTSNTYSKRVGPLSNYLSPSTSTLSKINEGITSIEEGEEEKKRKVKKSIKRRASTRRRSTELNKPKRTASRRSARHKGRTRKPTTLVLTDFERSKLDLPQQSARSKSRTRRSTGNDKKKIHECPLCHSRFQRPEHVKRHMRSHSSEKPFACPQPNCNKRFNRKDNLKQHLRKIHGLR